MDRDSDDATPSAIQLETPPPSEGAVSSMGALFADDAMALTLASAKAAVLESFLSLATRDCRYADFTREVLLTIMRVVKAEAGTLFELDKSSNSFFFRASVGQSSDQLEKFQIPMGQGVVGHVAESRQPVVVADVEKNSMHMRSIGDAVGFEARNLVAVPIIIRGEIYGVLELLNRLGEPTFSSSDVELLSQLCVFAAKAIEIRLMIAWGTRQKQRKEDNAA